MPLFLFIALYAVGAVALIYIAINVAALRLAGEPWLRRGTPLFPVRYRPRLPRFAWPRPAWLRLPDRATGRSDDDQDQGGEAVLRKRQLMPVSQLPVEITVAAELEPSDYPSVDAGDDRKTDLPPDFCAQVEARLAVLFDRHESGEIALGTYASLVQAERDSISRQLCELDAIVDGPAPRDGEDQRRQLQRAAQAIDWCLEWASKEAVLSW